MHYALSHKLSMADGYSFNLVCVVIYPRKYHISFPTLDISTTQKPQPPLFTISRGRLKRYHVDPSHLLSLSCRSGRQVYGSIVAVTVQW